ncbi:MAG TPA: ABC transporter ATP-binding protein [Streptosporangiaceae bacterium]|jgi:putative spermidine/putrescine transport system ATP-binding protein|nr:ABC transporter ATP-binding protein [Streptosporangiaceae bacterium]
MTTNAGQATGHQADRTARSTSGATVDLRNLSRSFGTTRALDGLTLRLAPGELVALLGPSGCGKTTALRIVAGFETADSGTVEVDGQDVSPVPAAKRDMGMVFQSYSLFPNMSALDNVSFGLRMRRLGSAERQRRATDLLDMVGLAPQAKQYPHQLSGGQQQRVALARALAIEPRVLLLDEPLSALDAKVRLQLREQIRSLQQRLGTTTLFVTHDQEEALSMADRVGVMRDGRLEQIATPDELYDRPATPFVAEFVGIMNRIPAGLLELLGASGLAADLTPHRERPGNAVDVLVRPEGLRITASPTGNGIVVGRTFLGQLTRVSVRLSGDVVVQVDLQSTEAAGIAPGDPVDVSLAGAPVMVAER